MLTRKNIRLVFPIAVTIFAALLGVVLGMGEVGLGVGIGSFCMV